MWSVCTIEYYAALKRTDVLIQATAWMNLKDVTLRGISQSQKDKYSMIPLEEVPGVVAVTQPESRRLGARGWGTRDGGQGFQFHETKSSRL